MKFSTFALIIIVLGTGLFTGRALAEVSCSGDPKTCDCSGLPEWKRQAYYLAGTEVQYQGSAYKATYDTKRDFPGQDGTWERWASVKPTTAEAVSESNPISIYGAWHCGNDYCKMLCRFNYAHVYSCIEFLLM